ncbi:MAG TPA: serine kinase [Nitrospirae bacterium]|nr:serine kinase [Nitrospirota bacterium]
MKLKEIVEILSLKPLVPSAGLEREVSGGYVGDLLSDVMANAGEGNIWITLQTHVNIVAVAVFKNLSAIVTVNGRMPDADTMEKAAEENIPILLTGKSAFETAGKLYQILNAKGIQD